MLKMHFSVTDRDTVPCQRGAVTPYGCWDSSLDEKTIQHRAPSSDDGYASPDVPGSDTSSSSVNHQLPRAVHFRDRPSDNVNVMRTIDDVTRGDRPSTKYGDFSTDCRGYAQSGRAAADDAGMASSRQISAALNRVPHERRITHKRDINDFENKLKDLLLDCYDDTHSSAASTLTYDQPETDSSEKRTFTDGNPLYESQRQKNCESDIANRSLSGAGYHGIVRPALPPTYEQACERQEDYRARTASRHFASTSGGQCENTPITTATRPECKAVCSDLNESRWSQCNRPPGYPPNSDAAEFQYDHSNPVTLTAKDYQQPVPAVCHNYLGQYDSDSGSTPIDTSAANANAENQPKSILRKRKRHNVRFSLEPNIIHEVEDVNYDVQTLQRVHPGVKSRESVDCYSDAPRGALYEPDHSRCGVRGQIDHQTAECGYADCELSASGNALVEAKVNAWLQYKHTVTESADVRRLGADCDTVDDVRVADSLNDSTGGYIDATKTRQVLDAISELLKQRPHPPADDVSASRHIAYNTANVGNIEGTLPSEHTVRGRNLGLVDQRTSANTALLPALPPGYVRLSERSLSSTTDGYSEIDDYNIAHKSNSVPRATYYTRSGYDSLMDSRCEEAMRTAPARTAAIKSASSAEIRQLLESRNTSHLPRQ